MDNRFQSSLANHFIHKKKKKTLNALGDDQIRPNMPPTLVMFQKKVKSFIRNFVKFGYFCKKKRAVVIFDPTRIEVEYEWP